MEQAFAVLRRPSSREAVEAALITGVPFEDVERTLVMYKQLPVSVGAIEFYEKTFFDVGAFTRAQLRVLVFARVRTAVPRRRAPTSGGSSDDRGSAGWSPPAPPPARRRAR